MAAATPALVWSKTVTINVRLASRSASPMALRCAAVIAVKMPPEHEAWTCALSERVILLVTSMASRVA